MMEMEPGRWVFVGERPSWKRRVAYALLVGSEALVLLAALFYLVVVAANALEVWGGERQYLFGSIVITLMLGVILFVLETIRSEAR